MSPGSFPKPRGSFSAKVSRRPSTTRITPAKTRNLPTSDMLVSYFMQRSKVVKLDVRELEPPMPMVVILKALESLEDGQELEVIGLKPFKHLLPKLEAAGYKYSLKEVEGGYLLRMWL